jgi:hypothetical protein
MSEFKLRVRRRIKENTSESRVREYIGNIGEASIKGLNYSFTVSLLPTTQLKDTYTFQADLKYKKEKGPTEPDILEREKSRITEQLQKAGRASRFTKYPFDLINPDGSLLEIERPEGAPEDILSHDFNPVGWGSLEIDESLITASDEEIENCEHFKGIFDRGPHIRMILGSIARGIQTGGDVRNHILLFGRSGAAKSDMIRGLKSLLPKDSWFALNADSMTRVGFVSSLLKKLSLTGFPAIMFLEEIDKVTDEKVLNPTLGLMDTRGFVQHITARSQMQVHAKMLFIVTANDKDLIDRFHGGKVGKPGALSSRLVHQLEVPRPTPDVMRKILRREIDAYGGNLLWIDAAMDLADEFGEDDPRKVIAYLDGGERLLDGSYASDMRRIYGARQQLSDMQQESRNTRILEDDDEDEYKHSLKAFQEFHKRNGTYRG